MSFFRRLGRRLTRDPNPDAERQLFLKLDAEFARDGSSKSADSRMEWRFSFRSFAFLRFAPLTAMAALMLVFASRLDTQSVISPVLVSNDPQDAAFLVDGREGPEFYDELEDWMLTASAEDWDLLLASDEGTDG